MTISRPGFRPGCHVSVLPGDGVYVLAEHGAAVLRGAVYERLAPLLDGTHSRDTLVDALADAVPAAEVYYALDHLARRGYIDEVDPRASLDDASRAEAAFWTACGLTASQAAPHDAGTPVAVVAIGGADSAAMTAALESVGVTVASDAPLSVVVADDYLHPDLALVNDHALTTGRPWLLCKPSGTTLWMGPLIRPGVSACWQCLAQRLRLQRTIDDYVQVRTPETTPLVLAPAALDATRDIAMALAAVQVATFLRTGRATAIEAGIATLDLRSLTTARHIVVRRPQCDRCGHAFNPDRLPDRPDLRKQAAAFEGDSGRRHVTPEETFAQFAHHISPITGLLDDLRMAAPAGESPSLLHVYRVGTGQAWAWGKGTTSAQARTAALCEALETASGRWHGDEPRVRGSLRSLGDRALHPNTCMLFSEQQYANRDVWNATCGQLRKIPEPFDEHAEMDWSPLWSLTHDIVRLLPAEYCYYGHPVRPVRCVADPNGHGAGNTIEEAVRHALLELIERDAAAMWWFTMARRPAVEIESFDLPFARKVQDHARRNGRVLSVLDLTTDFGIPVFAATSRSPVEGAEHISFGFGADFDPRVALIRALTEMEQLACTLPLAKDPWFRRWWKDATLADHPYLDPDTALPPYQWREQNAPKPMEALDAIMECRRRVEHQGLEVLVLDQTRPDIGLPTVQVVVPGLRHWRPPRFGPGRLYDVPVRLGWLAEPLHEDQLNPRFPPA